ncbi:hypothetical protein [Chakrabartyella piscis]|uniref:hypothetical protein n=1 Tax=Chakrabartyella piscis TaxID=2918914 RepID=UPI002958C847|nr:hypothetical protein [Chakrabartyella piscis]
MSTVMRYNIADYLNTGTDTTPAYSLMGVGFNTIDENPAPQKDSTTYVSEKSQTTSILSYQTSFAFDSDLISDEVAVKKLYDIGRNQLTGADAEVDYVRVELFEAGTTTGTFKARKFKVAVEVTSISGEGGAKVKVAGNLNGVGDFVDGTFNTTTNTFTATGDTDSDE